jgi:hypothetical protein
MLIAGWSSPEKRECGLEDGILFSALGQSRIAAMRPAHGNARYPPALLRLIMQAGFRWLGLRTYNGLEHINHFVRICQYFLSNTPGALTGADRVGVGKLKN